MFSIDQIIYLLNWDRSEEEQMQGIQYARQIQCIKTFFRPQGKNAGKAVWENCAKVISERPDDELEPYLEDMVFWIQDLNWPGADLILDRLKQFQDVKYLVTIIQDYSRALHKAGDASWLYGLSELLDDQVIASSLSPDVVNILRSENEDDS